MTHADFLVVETFVRRGGKVIVLCDGPKDLWRPGQRVHITRPDREAIATTVLGVDYMNPPLPDRRTSILVGPDAAGHAVPGATIRLELDEALADVAGA